MKEHLTDAADVLFEAEDSEGIRFLLRQRTGRAKHGACFGKSGCKGRNRAFQFPNGGKAPPVPKRKKGRGLSYRMEKYKVNGQMTDQGAQRREEQLAAVGEKILKASRSALYLKMRFLDVALCSLFFVQIRMRK